MLYSRARGRIIMGWREVSCDSPLNFIDLKASQSCVPKTCKNSGPQALEITDCYN